MIELSQKEVEAVSGGSFGLLSKIICAKINFVKTIFKCLLPKPCQPQPQPKPPKCDNIQDL